MFWFGPLFIGGAIALFLWSRTEPGRLTVDAFILKIPLAGNLVVQLSVAQATRSLATLAGWRHHAGRVVGDRRRVDHQSRAAATQLRDPADDSRRPHRLPKVWKSPDWMPLLAIDMIGIGERSGSLREMLDEVAVFYDAESEVRLEQLTTTLEPAILVVMGGIVVTILAGHLPADYSIDFQRRGSYRSSLICSAGSITNEH